MNLRTIDVDDEHALRARLRTIYADCRRNLQSGLLSRGCDVDDLDSLLAESDAAWADAEDRCVAQYYVMAAELAGEQRRCS